MRFVLSLVALLCVCVDGYVFSDERLKTGVTSADTYDILEKFRKITVREFDYLYEQFYNPIFGRRQIGFIAQELSKVFPSAVGYVPRKRLNQNTTLQNLHVVNQDALFVSNIAATQEIARNAEALNATVSNLTKTLSSLRHGELAELNQTTKKILDDVTVIKSDLKKAHKSVQDLESGSEQKHLYSINKFHQLDQTHSNLSHSILRLSVKQEGDVTSLDSKMTNKIENIREEIEIKVLESLNTANQAKMKLEVTDRQVSQIATDTSDMKQVSDKLVNQVSLQDISVDNIKKDISKNFDDLVAEREKLNAHGLRLNGLDEFLGKTREEINKQAQQEVVERRRLKEAEVTLASKQVDLEKIRAKETRQTEEYRLQLELEKEDQLMNKTLEQSKEQEKIREKTEISILEAQHAAKMEENELRSKVEMDMLKETNKFNLEKIEAEKATTLEKAKIEAEMETVRERENHHVRVNLSKVEGEQKRLSAISTIKTLAEETRNSIRMMADSPREILRFLGFGAGFVFFVYLSREVNTLIRKRIELSMGKPSLIRETSKLGEIKKLKNFFLGLFKLLYFTISFPIYLTMHSRMSLWSQEFQSLQSLREKPVEEALKEVVLRDDVKAQVFRICRSTKNAFQRGTNLRHIMLYGPPGTGKTMVAKKLALWCGLDFAIMSGADVSPLKEQAVTEIHNLFSWAKKLKGVLLFIDEADAFLASRDRQNQSENMRNALTALLYHTSSNNELQKRKSVSGRVMLVLATNRPKDLDFAVLDRIDESVEFPKPDFYQRKQLLCLYFDLYLMKHFNFKLTAGFIDTVARAIEGFSGRQIAKLMITFQSHLYASGEITVPETKSNGNLFGRLFGKPQVEVEDPVKNIDEASNCILLQVIKQAKDNTHAMNLRYNFGSKPKQVLCDSDGETITSEPQGNNETDII